MVNLIVQTIKMSVNVRNDLRADKMINQAIEMLNTLNQADKTKIINSIEYKQAIKDYNSVWNK